MSSSRARLVVVIVATTLTGIATNSLIAPAIPDILTAFDAPDGAAGWIVAAGSLPGIVVAPAVGFLADRFGRREVLVPCLVLHAVAGGAAALAPSLTVLVVLRAVQGIGSAGLINLAVVVIGDHWEGNRRTTMIGRNAAVLTVGLALFPFLGGVLVDLGGWRAPFAAYPVGLLTAALVLTSLGRSRREPVDVREQVRAVAPVLRTRPFLATVVAMAVVFVLIFGAKLTVLPVALERDFGLSGTIRGIVLGLPAVGSTIGSLLTGRLAGTLGMRRTLLGASGLFVATLLALAVAPTLVVAVPAIVVFGFAEGLTVPSLQNLAASSGDASQRGTLVATLVGFARLGQTVGPLSVGAVAGAAGSAAGFGATAVLALVALPVLARVATSRPAEAGSPSDRRRTEQIR